ncbi:MAG: LemA family protein [Bacteroidota bacterium]
MKNRLLLFVLSIALLVSCKQTQNTNRIKDADSLKTQFTALNDSITSSWQVMMTSDSTKLGNIKRLLQEVSYSKVHNQPLLDSLMQQQAALLEKRYTIETMTSDKIDAYDAATDLLLGQLPRLTASVPDLERYPLCAELSQEIDAASQAVLLHRIHYDKYAKQYNQFISDYSKDLAELGYTGLKPKLLFQLSS